MAQFPIYLLYVQGNWRGERAHDELNREAAEGEAGDTQQDEGGEREQDEDTS